MINRQFLYSTACAVVVLGACVYVPTASAQTTYDGGSVMVYDLQGPPPTVMAQPMPQPVQTYPVAAPAYEAPAPVTPSYAPRAVSVMDTSYAPGSLYIVGSSAKQSSSPVIATPVSAAAINAPAPVAIPAPAASAPPKPARTAMDMIAEAKQNIQPAQNAMAPIVDGDMGGAAPVPAPVLQNAVAPQPAPAPMMSVANAPMMSSVSGTRSAENCAVNESLVQKITLLEREKESIRKQALGLGGMETIARCASENHKIQSLEAQLAYLREENESLKRLNNEHFATQAAMATSPATLAVEEAPIEVPPAEQSGL